MSNSSVFDKKPPTDKFLYHYTTGSTALEHILPQGRLRLGQLEGSNDPREWQYWSFGVTDFSRALPDSEFHSARDMANKHLRDRIRFICFSVDEQADPQESYQYYGRGFGHPRMWAQYAENHSGICLIFNKIKLRKCISKDVSTGGFVIEGDIDYVTHMTQQSKAFKIQFDEMKKVGGEAYFRKYFGDHFAGLYMQKSADWRDENEFRFVLRVERNETHYFEAGSALEGLILGSKFPEEDEPVVREFCLKYKIPAARMWWYNGFPTLVANSDELAATLTPSQKKDLEDPG